MPISQLDQQLLDAAKKGRKEFDELYTAKKNEFTKTFNQASADYKKLLGRNAGTEVDAGGGFKIRKGQDYKQDYGKNGSTSWATFDIIDPQGNVVQNIRHTNSKSTRQQLSQAFAKASGSGILAADGFNQKISYLQGLGLSDPMGQWDKQYKEQRAKIDSQDYGTFIAPQTGKQVVMHTPEDLKNALVLGFKKVSDGTTQLKPEEISMIQAAGYKGKELQASLDAYNKANPPAQGVQQTYDPVTGKTTYADGRVEQSTAPKTGIQDVYSFKNITSADLKDPAKLEALRKFQQSKNNGQGSMSIYNNYTSLASNIANTEKRIKDIQTNGLDAELFKEYNPRKNISPSYYESFLKDTIKREMETLSAQKSSLATTERNFLDAVNSDAIIAGRLSEKMNDVIANGYKPGTEQYESRLKEYTSFYSQLPDFMKVGNAAPSEITTSSIKPPTYSIASAGQTQQPMGDAVYRVNGKLMSAEAAKAAGVDITKLTPESGSAYVDNLGATSTSTSSTSTPTGTIPGMKNIFTDKKDVLANDAMVNQLFKAYHGRDANLQELNYWRTKKIGDLENTLAKTQIFSKEDADKIRAQMMSEGKTYISNQAELSSLASQGKITPEGLTSVSQQGGMLFQGTPTTTSGGTGTGGTGTGGATGTGGTGTGGTGTGTATDGATGEDALIETIANAVGDPNAADTDILAALNNVKNSQIDPYYKQLISQAQKDVMTSINRQYEDRIRQLQTESFNMAENIKNTQKSLEQSGMTFSGDAIAKLGTLAAFGQSTPAGLTPAQLDQNGNPVSGGTPVQNQTLPQTAVGLPTMTAEQMGLEGSVNMQNRLYSESSRSLFNRGLEDTGQAATRLLGTQGVQNLGLPSQATAGQPQTTGTMQYDYANTLQNTYGNLAAQEGNLTDYQRLFL